MSRHFEFDGETLVKALRATFARRKTELPDSTPQALSDDFSKIKALQWGAFLRKSQLGPIEMPAAIESIHQFANAPLEHAARGEPFLLSWTPEAGWR